MKESGLPAETRERILDAAWDAIARRGRGDVSLAEIARGAGVSRQSLYLAFGDRKGLLLAMARRQDAASPHVRRMREILERGAGDEAALFAFVDAWLAHLPEIYPVAVLLLAAALTDADAASVINDRMVRSLLGGYRGLAGRLAAAGRLRPGLSAEDAAAFCWSLTHVDAWRHLVVEQGWPPERFAQMVRLSVATVVLAG